MISLMTQIELVSTTHEEKELLIDNLPFFQPILERENGRRDHNAVPQTVTWSFKHNLLIVFWRDEFKTYKTIQNSMLSTDILPGITQDTVDQL